MSQLVLEPLYQVFCLFCHPFSLTTEQKDSALKDSWLDWALVDNAGKSPYFIVLNQTSCAVTLGTYITLPQVWDWESGGLFCPPHEGRCNSIVQSPLWSYFVVGAPVGETSAFQYTKHLIQGPSVSPGWQHKLCGTGRGGMSEGR